MNEDLLTPEQIRIRNLELTIRKFKEYDANRKKYYSEIELELGMLQSEVAELKEENEGLKQGVNEELQYQVEKLKKKVAHQKEEINKMQIKIVSLNLPDSDLDNETSSAIAIKTELLRLRKLLAKYKSFNEELIYQLGHPETDTIMKYLRELDQSENAD